MIIVTPPKTFKPLTVTFESQQEIDEFFAVLNHRYIAECLPCLGRYSGAVEEYSSEDYSLIHEKLCKLTNP